MAEQVTVSLNLDSSNLQSSIDRAAAAIAKLQGSRVTIPVTFLSETDKLTRDINSATSSVTNLAQQSENTVAAMQRKIQAAKDLRTNLDRVVKASQDELRATESVNPAWKAKLAAVIKAELGVKKLTGEIDRLERKVQASKAAAELLSKTFSRLQSQQAASAEGGFFDSLLGKLTLGGIAVEAFKQALAGIGNFLQRGATLEQLTLSLEAFTGSTQAAAATYQSFRETAIATPFSVAGVADAGKTLLAFGLDTNEATDSTRRLAIIAGATGSDLNNLARNLGQISAQGRAYTRDLNQFATAGIPIYQKLADQLNISVAEVRQFAEEGKIGFTEVKQAIVSLTVAGTAFSQIANRQLETISGQWGNLQTAIDDVALAFVRTFGPTIVNGLKALSSGITVLAANFGTFSTAVISLATVALLSKLGPALQSAVLAFKIYQGATLGSAAATALFTSAVAKGVGTQYTAQIVNAALAANQLRAGIIGAALGFTQFAAAAALAFTAFSTFKATYDAYQPKQIFKDDINQANAFSKEINDLRTKYSGLANATPVVTAVTEEFSKAVAFNAAAVGQNRGNLYQYNLVLRTIESNIIASAEATNAQGNATLSLIKANNDYTKSGKVTIQGLQEYIGVSKARVDSLQQENQGLAGQVAALRPVAKGNSEVAKLAQLQIGIFEGRINANNTFIKVLQKQIAEQQKLVTAETAYNVALRDPSLENRTIAMNMYQEELGAVIKSITAVLKAEQTLAEAPLRELEAGAKRISIEYDRQVGLLKNQKTQYDDIVSYLDAVEKIEARRRFGQANTAKELELQLDIAEIETQRAKRKADFLGLSTLAGKQANLDYITSLKSQTSLEAQLSVFNEKYAAETKSLETNAKILDLEQRKGSALAGVNDAIVNQKAASDATVLSIQRQERVLAQVAAAATIAGSAIDKNIRGSIEQSIGRTNELLTRMREIANLKPAPGSVLALSGGSAPRAAGGPVAGGNTYTVNELGREAFLSASGRLSMINAPSWGQWKAPSSGVVIPAHLTRQLSIPRGGINLADSGAPSVAKRALLNPQQAGNSAVNNALRQIGYAQQTQAQELGKLARAVDRLQSKEFTVDVNINGNNPLLNKLRRMP